MPLLRSRKGIELSINIIVILIITVVIFGLAIGLTFKLFGGAEDVGARLDAEAERQIRALLLQPNTLVAVPFKTVEGARSETVKFGLGIRNIGKARDYRVIVSFDQGFDNAGREFQDYSKDYIDAEWLKNFAKRWQTVKENELATVPILIRVDARLGEGIPTKPGKYTFNVCVIKGPAQDGSDQGDWETVGDICSVEAYTGNRNAFYGQRIERVTVIVT
jgi:hypothetical protein